MGTLLGIRENGKDREKGQDSTVTSMTLHFLLPMESPNPTIKYLWSQQEEKCAPLPTPLEPSIYSKSGVIVTGYSQSCFAGSPKDWVFLLLWPISLV